MINKCVNSQVYETVMNIVQGICPLRTMKHQNDFDKNVELACASIVADEFRSIDGKKLEYILNNFGAIVLGIVSSEDFRSFCVQAVAYEEALDGEDVSVIEDFYNHMKDEHDFSSGHKVVINFETYDDDTCNKVLKNITASLHKIDGCAQLTHDALFDLEGEPAMNDVYYVFCNFMYLFRAFANNGIFFIGMKNTIDKCYDTLVIF